MGVLKQCRRWICLPFLRRQGQRPSRKQLEQLLTARVAELAELQLRWDLQEDCSQRAQQRLQSALQEAEIAQQDAQALANMHCSLLEQQMLQMLDDNVAASLLARQKLAASNTTNEQLKQQVAAQHDKLQQHKQRDEQHVHQLAELQQQLVSAKQQKQQLQQEVDAAAEAQQLHLQQLIKQHKAADQELQNQIAELQRALSSVQSQHHELQHDYAQLSDQLVSTKQELQSSRTACQDLLAAKEAAEAAACEASNNRVAALAAMTQQHQQELAAVECCHGKKVSQAAAAHKQLVVQLQKEKAQATQHQEKQLNKLQQQLESAKQQKQQLQQEVDAAEAQQLHLQQLIKQHTAAGQELQNQLAELQAAFASVKSQHVKDTAAAPGTPPAGPATAGMFPATHQKLPFGVLAHILQGRERQLSAPTQAYPADHYHHHHHHHHQQQQQQQQGMRAALKNAKSSKKTFDGSLSRVAHSSSSMAARAKGTATLPPTASLQEPATPPSMQQGSNTAFAPAASQLNRATAGGAHAGSAVLRTEDGKELTEEALLDLLLSQGIGEAAELVYDLPKLTSIMAALTPQLLLRLERAEGDTVQYIKNLLDMELQGTGSSSSSSSNNHNMVMLTPADQQHLVAAIAQAPALLKPSKKLANMVGQVGFSNANNACCSLNSFVQLLLHMASGAAISVMQVQEGKGAAMKAVQHMLEAAVQGPHKSEQEQWQQPRTRKGKKGSTPHNVHSSGGHCNGDDEMPWFKFTDSITAKQMIVQGHPDLKMTAESHLGPGELVALVLKECQQLGGAALSMLQRSWGTIVLNHISNKTEHVYDVYSMQLEDLALLSSSSSRGSSAVTRLLQSSVKSAHEQGGMKADPAALSLVRGPADLLVHVQQLTNQCLPHKDLRDAVHQLPQQVDLDAVFAPEGNQPASSKSSKSSSSMYELRGMCASTWPDRHHVVAVVKTMRGDWLLLDDGSTPKSLGTFWTDVAGSLTGNPHRSYQPLLLLYSRVG